MRLMEGAMKRTSGRVDKISDKGVNEAGYALGEKMAGTQRAEIIAPRRIVEAVRAGIEESFEAGLRKEREGFAACMETAATRNMIYLFFAGRKTGRVAEIAGATPREVRRAAVVGMGSMGTGIAHALIMAGVEAVVVDEDEGALERGAAKIRRSVEKQAAAGRVSRGEGEEMLGRLRMTREWGEIAGADLVIEAVYEDAGLKRKVIGEIARVCSGDCIIATNTSTLSLDVLAEGMKGAERFVGMHFFNPAQRMPLVEVIRREGVDKGVLAGAAAFAKRMGKVPVVVRNREGFVVNRIFIGYLKEAFYLLGDGADARAVDAAAVEFGFPMGPLALMDMTGLDVLSFTDEVMREAFAHYGEAAGVLEALVARGRLGQKRGKGVYRYEEGDYTAVDDPECERIIAEARGEGDKKACGVDKEMIVERLLMRMVSEGLRVAEEGIAERESDIDVAMVMGTGFPGFRGGVLRYARDMGMRTVVERLDALAGEYGERFGSSEFLQRLKGAQ
jgi:3-hydroxyacyl-CoA dehydrogenase